MKRFLLFFILLSPPVYAGPTVYLTASQALKLLFADSSEVVLEKKSANQKTWNFYIAKTGGKIDGYALIDNEIGKTEPITFITAITPDGHVKAVEIMVYRESHGGAVKEKGFVKQYKGKSAANPVRVGQDIKNVTGATLSSRAVTRGVKRALTLWENFYGKK